MSIFAIAPRVDCMIAVDEIQTRRMLTVVPSLHLPRYEHQFRILV